MSNSSLQRENTTPPCNTLLPSSWEILGTGLNKLHGQEGWEQPKQEENFEKPNLHQAQAQWLEQNSHCCHSVVRPAVGCSSSGMVLSGWKPGFHPELMFSFELQGQICASHLNLKNCLWSGLLLWNNHGTRRQVSHLSCCSSKPCTCNY